MTGAPLVSVIVTGEPSPALAATVTALLAQSCVHIEVVVAGCAGFDATAALAAIPALQMNRVRIVGEGPGSAAALRAATGAYVCWVAPGVHLHPRRIERQLEALGANGTESAGVCFRAGAAPLRAPPSWSRPRSGGSVVADMVAGCLDMASLLVARQCLDGGGEHADGSGLRAFDIAIRLALRRQLAVVDAMGPTHVIQPTSLDGVDALLARRLGECGSGAREAAVIEEIRRAVDPGQWPATWKAIDAAIDAMAGEAGIAVGVASEDERALLARAGTAGPAIQAVVTGGLAPLDAARRLIEACDAGLALLAGPAPPDADGLRRQLLRLTAGDLAACLPVADDGLFHTGSGASLLPGTLFRRDALQSALAVAGEDEARFWHVVGPVDAMDPVFPGPIRRRSIFEALAAAREQAVAEAPGEPVPITDAEVELRAQLVDADWYRAAYVDVVAAGIDPVEHYLQHGWREGRDPSPWFATTWYLKTHGSAGGTIAPELTHFVRWGARRGLRPHPDVDLEWYASRYLSEPPGAEALVHLMRHWRDGAFLLTPRLDSPLVRAFVESMPPAARLGGVRRLDRWAAERETAGAPSRQGWEVLRPSHDAIAALLVDPDYYRLRQPGLSPDEAPLAHYRGKGWRAGADPNPAFSTHSYLARYPDVAVTGMCPLDHYIDHGAAEQRITHPWFDVHWYGRRYLSPGIVADDPLAPHLDFVVAGHAAGRVPNAELDHPAVALRLLEVGAAQRLGEMEWLWDVRYRLKAGPVTFHPVDVARWPAIVMWHAPGRRLPRLTAKAGGEEARDGALVLSAEGDVMSLVLEAPGSRPVTVHFVGADAVAQARALLVRLAYEPDAIADVLDEVSGQPARAR